MEMACKAAMLDSLVLGEAIQLPVMKRNIDERGVENRYWSDAMLQVFKEKWQEVVDEESAKDPGFKKIWDNLSAFRRDYEIWNRWPFCRVQVPSALPTDNLLPLLYHGRSR